MIRLCKYLSRLAVLSLMSISVLPQISWAMASNNIPLDSPVYRYLEKLEGFGLITEDVSGVKPFSKAEVARLLAEAEANLAEYDGAGAGFAASLVTRIRDLIPREASLRKEPDRAPLLDANPLTYARLRYVYLDGVPRNYTRDVFVKGGAKVFGFIGGNLRPQPDEIDHKSGTEGTPLLENNEGVIYSRGNNAELRFAMEGYAGSTASMLIEPLLLHTPEVDQLKIQKGYAKLGGGGLELEVGRDANWFGPGYRGTVTLTNNAQNFDQIKLSSPEPLDVGWVKEYLGDFKYSLIFSRFDETGAGSTLRQPYFLGLKLALKPKPWFEIGGNFVRQEGGPGLSGHTSITDFIFGGGNTNKSNSIAGLDMRFRIPWLRNTELYGEFAGEDSALFWPILESYVAGIYIPRLTDSGQDDFRFEYFWGHAYLYSDFKFPEGYVYHGMTPGHSQGGGAQDFFFRYSHWFSPRNNLALEYIHTDRGKVGKVPGSGQQVEELNAWRAFWNLPVYGEFDLNTMCGWERVNNFNMVAGATRTNQIVKIDLNYRY